MLALVANEADLNIGDGENSNGAGDISDDNDNTLVNPKHARTMRSTREPVKESIKTQPKVKPVHEPKPKRSRKLARPLDDEFMEVSRGDWRCWGGIDY